MTYARSVRLARGITADTVVAPAFVTVYDSDRTARDALVARSQPVTWTYPWGLPESIKSPPEFRNVPVQIEVAPADLATGVLAALGLLEILP
jgi:hypothetical protein